MILLCIHAIHSRRVYFSDITHDPILLGFDFRNERNFGYPKFFPFLWLYACGAMTAMTCAYQAYDRLPIGDAVGKLMTGSLT